MLATLRRAAPSEVSQKDVSPQSERDCAKRRTDSLTCLLKEDASGLVSTH